MTLPDFDSRRVAVVGDVILDRYVHARPERLSREAPVMVLRQEREVLGAGGAANVARNLRALGAEVRLFGAVGLDAEGRELFRLLEADGIDVAGLAAVRGRMTPTKSRILAAEPGRSLRHVVRIDREPLDPAPSEILSTLVECVGALVTKIDALLIADYDYGVVGDMLGDVARAYAGRGKVVVLDPRGALEPYRGVTAVTPNTEELARFTGCEPIDLADPHRVREAALELRARVECEFVLVTRGNAGMALFGGGELERGALVQASGPDEVVDVCGAGDTAAATFALALAAGQEPVRAMQIANAAAGLVVQERGTGVCSPAELASALRTTARVRELGKSPVI